MLESVVLNIGKGEIKDLLTEIAGLYQLRNLSQKNNHYIEEFDSNYIDQIMCAYNISEKDVERNYWNYKRVIEKGVSEVILKPYYVNNVHDFEYYFWRKKTK